jgi:hypothetical protein
MRSRTARRLVVLTSAVAAALVLTAPFARADTVSFTTPGPTQFEVPADVCSLSITVNGGQGGNARGRVGGAGAQIQGTLAVTPGEILGISVAGAGGTPDEAGSDPQPGGVGGIGGGGPGGTGAIPRGDPPVGSNAAPGGGGGGASDVRQAAGGSGCVPCATPVPPDSPGNTLADRVIVAGGGGGSGFGASGNLVYGGAGGGTSGGTPNGDGAPSFSPGGVQGGVAGANGGAGGTGGDNPGTAGAPNLGGTGGAATSDAGVDENAAGGGGGGGVAGGGGGSSGDYAAGGGGGASFIAAQVTGAVNSPGGAPADTAGGGTPRNGSIIISYSTTDTCPAVAPAAATALTLPPSFAG